MVKRKNWWIWWASGIIANALVLSFSDVTISLLCLIVEIICYGIGLYKLFKGKED